MIQDGESNEADVNIISLLGDARRQWQNDAKPFKKATRAARCELSTRSNASSVAEKVELKASTESTHLSAERSQVKEDPEEKYFVCEVV